jgi:hypothetical protein
MCIVRKSESDYALDSGSASDGCAKSRLFLSTPGAPACHRLSRAVWALSQVSGGARDSLTPASAAVVGREHRTQAPVPST